MKIQNLILCILISPTYLMANDLVPNVVRTSNPKIDLLVKDIELTENECTPFDLEKKGNVLENVPFSHQFYANCYSAGAANILNTWIKNKIKPEQGNADKYMVSPHHLAIVYALEKKGLEFPNSWQSDWSVKRLENLSQKEYFHKMKFEKTKTSSQEKILDDIIVKRMYYFSEYGGGSTISTIKNVIGSRVCPFKRVEQAFGTVINGQDFFRNSRKLYQEFLNKYDKNDVNETALKSSAKELNNLFKKLKVEDAYISENDFRQAVMPNGKIDETDPLHYIDQVFLNLCSKSKTHGPVRLKNVFAGLEAVNLPTPSPTIRSSSPMMNKRVIEAHFEKILSGVERQLPISISYAGHAIWEGTEHLAWKWDEKLASWKQDPKYGGHQGLITGRRWNTQNQTCEYALRNSFLLGETKKGWTKDPKMKYRLWIKDSYLFSSINWLYYLVDANNRP